VSGNNESAGKRKSGKTRNGNPIVRYLLCARAMIVFLWPRRITELSYLARNTVLVRRAAFAASQDGAAGRGTRVETSRPLQDDDCCIDPREVPGAVRREMIGPEFRSVFAGDGGWGRG
jgi:hypothetical protein